jgi:hypothetical protein
VVKLHGSFWYSSSHSDRLLVAGNKPLWAKLIDGSIVEYTAMNCKTGYGDEIYLGEGASIGAMSYDTAHKLKGLP